MTKFEIFTKAAHQTADLIGATVTNVYISGAFMRAVVAHTTNKRATAQTIYIAAGKANIKRDYGWDNTYDLFYPDITINMHNNSDGHSVMLAETIRD